MHKSVQHLGAINTQDSRANDDYRKFMQDAAQRTEHLYVLADTRHYPLSKHFQRWHVTCYRSLWDTLTANDCSDIAPYLLHVAAPGQLKNASEPGSISSQALVAQLISKAIDKPMLTWLWSDKSFDDIYDHLQGWAECHTEDKQSILMHFYDNRILPIWLAVLTPEQRQAFTSNASEWWYADRDGQKQVLNGDSESVAVDLPIKLTNEQENALVNANAADCIISDINSIAVELTENKPYPALYREVDGLLNKAKSYLIDSYSDQAKFVMLGLMYGPEFDMHTQLQPEWEKLKTSAIDFASLVDLAHALYE